MATNIFHETTDLLTFSMTHEVSWKMLVAINIYLITFT